MEPPEQTETSGLMGRITGTPRDEGYVGQNLIRRQKPHSSLNRERGIERMFYL